MCSMFHTELAHDVRLSLLKSRRGAAASASAGAKRAYSNPSPPPARFWAPSRDTARHPYLLRIVVIISVKSIIVYFRRYRPINNYIKRGIFGQLELFDPKLTRHFLQYAQNTRRPTCAGVDNRIFVYKYLRILGAVNMREYFSTKIRFSTPALSALLPPAGYICKYAC
jgi:hypothetical protein